MEAKVSWRKRARRILADAFGGKCAVCGYSKCISALDYHHVGSDKDSALSKAMRDGHAWYKIVSEARKCALVCCRCHREIHAGVAKLPQNYARFDERYASILEARHREFDDCPVCGKQKWVKRLTCSTLCRDRYQKKLPNDDELIDLRQTMTYTEIGDLFDVTEAAVRKRFKKITSQGGDSGSIPLYRIKKGNYDR